MMRETISVPPPGPKPPSTRSGLSFGHSACAEPVRASTANASAAHRPRFIAPSLTVRALAALVVCARNFALRSLSSTAPLIPHESGNERSVARPYLQFLVLDRIAQRADAFDLDFGDVTGLHPHWLRLACMADAGRRAGEQNVARLECHTLGQIDERLRDWKHQQVRVGRLHHLAVEPRLDLQPLAAARQFVGSDHPRADAARAVEILAHAPLRRMPLIFADGAFVADRVAGDAVERGRHRDMLRALADNAHPLPFI